MNNQLQSGSSSLYPFMVSQSNHEPEQHIIGLRDGSGKIGGPFLGHDNPRLVLDASWRETMGQDPEKRKQGQSKKIILCPGRNGTR